MYGRSYAVLANKADGFRFISIQEDTGGISSCQVLDIPGKILDEIFLYIR